LGAVVSMLTGLLITPALLTVMPHIESETDHEVESVGFGRLSDWIMRHSGKIVTATAALLVVSCVGVLKIESKIDPLDFLPQEGKVRADVRRVEADLTNLDSIEAVVDFSGSDLPFLDRLAKVRKWESEIAQHPSVRHTMSLASFFPGTLPESPLALMKLLQRAESKRGRNDYVANGENLWRISARIDPTAGKSTGEVYHELSALMAGTPIQFTGIAPLLNQAQHEIFSGFWKSFSSAFVVITLVMLLSLRCFVTTMVAMLTNLVPIAVIFGLLGWSGMPVDIGMMMTGSIALGITVDGTFHFLARYQEQYVGGKTSARAVRDALVTTGGPVFESIVVSSIGMLALTLSSFAPTARFGYLMASLLLAALAGGLIVLPALLCLRPTRKGVPATVPVPAEALRGPTHRRVARLPVDRVA
jgi:predicted RND superfamily exporter protein